MIEKTSDIFDKPEPKGFIADYSKMILDRIPTSKDWAEAIALTVESVVLSKITFSTEIGPIKLNIWNLMVGPSGLAHKTNPLKYYVYPTLKEITELIEKPVIMPSRFSIEGFIEYVSGSFKAPKGSKKKIWVEGNSIGCIIRDEFTALFKEASNKQYLADIMEFLSEVFDCLMQKRYTRKAKLEQAKEIYVSLLAATTPYVFSVMERNFFIQGTGNRLLYTLFKPSKPKRINPTTYFSTGKRERERGELISSFAKDLASIYNSNLTTLFPTPEASVIYADFKKKLDDLSYDLYLKNPQNIIYTYLQRLPVATLKIAGLSTISRGYKNIYKLRHDTLMVGKEDMRWAITKVNRHYDHFKALLDQWEITPKEAQPEIHERELFRILSFVRDSEDKMLTQSELLSYSGSVKSRKFYELIATLISRGELDIVPKEEVEKFSREVRIKHLLLIQKKGKWVKSYRGQFPNVYRYVKTNSN